MKPKLLSVPLLSNIEFAFSNFLTVTASSFLLVHYYQSFLIRLCYIALLCYWNIHITHHPGLFGEILLELCRSKRYRGGETSWDGKHWTLNIAEIILTGAFCWGFNFLFPTYHWTPVFLVFFWNFLFPYTHLGQLLLQKQITRLARFDRNVWRWSVLAIESACLSIMRLLDFQTTRDIVKLLWWMCYQFTKQVTPEIGDKFIDSIFFMSLIHWSNPNTKYLSWIINSWIQYRLWFQKLGEFANPEPSEHKYTPLKKPEDIRVLLLLPRFAFGPICCSLVQGPHMRLLFYEAISYNWDSMDTTEEILIDGCRKKVTKSVYEILASYSSLLVPKVLWIDAICIDQESDVEKSQQVPLMEKIYLNALFTTIFLGRSPLAKDQDLKNGSLYHFRYDGSHPIDKKTKRYFEDTRLAFDLLNEFRVLKSALENSSLTVYEAYDNLQSPKSKGRQWAALLKMLQHPVFERVWVVQEVALSGHVQVRYGDEVIDWEVLASGMEMLQNSRNFHLWLEWTHEVELRNIQHTSLYNITRMQRFRQTCRPRGDWSDYEDRLDGWDTGLPKLLAESFFFKATDPRDLVYGIMSLCRDPMKVSYKDSVEEVFLAAAKELLQRGAVHLLLHTAGVGNRLEANSAIWKLPSWVPDWTDAPKYKGLQDLRASRPWKRPKAEPEVKVAIKLKGNRMLTFSGNCVDAIDELGPVIFNTPYQAGERTVDAMFQLAIKYESCWRLTENSPRTADPYPHTRQDQSLRDAFRRTITVNERDGKWNQSPNQMLGEIAEWEEKLKSFCHKPSPGFPAKRDDMYKILQSMDKVTELIRSRCGGRRFFISRKGYIGLCPPHALRGDLIYIVPGILKPIMLRRVTIGTEGRCVLQDSVKRYRLVGECHAHELMNRETAPMGTLEEVEIL